MPNHSLFKISEPDFFLHIPDRVNRGKTFKDYGIEEAQWGLMGNFCVAILRTKKGEMFVGVSKRNPTDPYTPEVGLDIAAVRAFKALKNEDPGYDRQHPVSKRGAKRASNEACLEAVFNAVAEGRVQEI